MNVNINLISSKKIIFELLSIVFNPLLDVGNFKIVSCLDFNYPTNSNHFSAKSIGVIFYNQVFNPRLMSKLMCINSSKNKIKIHSLVHPIQLSLKPWGGGHSSATCWGYIPKYNKYQFRSSPNRI